MILRIFVYRRLSYSLLSIGSSHSVEVFSPGISNARCANQLSAAAPCQCFTPDGMCITVLRFSGHADEHLSSAIVGVVDMPVIPASRFESDVGKRNLCAGYACKIAVACKISRIRGIRFSYGKYHLALEC